MGDNILAVAQTVLVAPLWAMMHTRPDNSFVGQERQGYLMFMSLFVRPSLAILGLFLACLIADPVINFVATAFFEMRDALQKGSGAMGVLSSFHTYVWWFAAFGLTLLPILYMIFFLPQTLPDEILRWLGGGLNSLGDSTAVGAVQTGLAGMYGRAAMYGKASGKLGGRGRSASGEPSKGGGGSGGGSGGGAVITSDQGVAPSSGRGGGTAASPRQRATNNAVSSYVRSRHNPPGGNTARARQPFKVKT